MIPQPLKVKPGQGSFQITDNIPVLINGRDTDIKQSALLFTERLKLSGGPVLKLMEITGGDKNIPSVIFQISKEGKSRPKVIY